MHSNTWRIQQMSVVVIFTILPVNLYGISTTTRSISLSRNESNFTANHANYIASLWSHNVTSTIVNTVTTNWSIIPRYWKNYARCNGGSIYHQEYLTPSLNCVLG